MPFAFAYIVQRVHLSTEEPAADRMLEPFEEVEGDVPEYFSSREHILLKLKIKKLLRKIRSKNLTAGVFFSILSIYTIISHSKI